MQALKVLRTSWLAALLMAAMCLIASAARAQSQSYVNSSDTYNWIDASQHNRIRVYSSTYSYPGNPQPPAIAFPRTAPPWFFYTPAGVSCGTSGTIIDDTLTDQIPIGFTFNFAGVNFTAVRISSNGRIQFNNNLTCGSGTDNGTPTIYTYDYPDAGMNYTMRIYGADLDSTPKYFNDAGVLTAVNAGYNTVCQDDAQCYISVATIGSAPTRKFVVTWNNVPKWTTGAVIVGNFNLQLILEEGGDFVYQFGNVADSQPGVPAQIGWQVNTNDYDIKQTALPTNFSAIRYQKPRPILQYQMEQANWTTAAGQVLDTSGNGNNGSRLGAAQTTANGYACIGANIPANSSTATVDAINTNYNISSQLGSVGTITFWYKPTQWVGNAAASTDAMLFDATTANNGWFYLSKLRVSNTTSKLRFAVRDSGGTTRTVETAAMSTSVLSGGWIHIAASWNFNTLGGTNNDRLRIYVNGQAISSGNSVQSAFSSSASLDATIGTLYIGDNHSTFTDGANSSGNSANGVIDEFKLYNLEAGYGQVLTDYTATAGCSNHYAITHAGSGASPTTGATCQANAVSVTMHTSADAPIPTSSTINLSTSTGNGNWTLIAGYGTLTPGAANSGTATYKFNNESQVILGYTRTTAGTVNFNVTDGSFSEQQSAAEDANLTIQLCTVAGFNGCEYKAASRCSPATANYDRLITRLAGNDLVLDALTLNASGAVDTTFNKNVTVDLLANVTYSAPNPVTYCPASQTSTIGLGTVAFTNGRVSTAGIPVTAATIAAAGTNYSTYGDVRMRFTCSATDCPPSGLTVCSRDAFALRPADIVLTATTQTNASVTTGTPKLAAGTQFPMTAQAKTSTGANAVGYSGTPQITATIAAQSVSAQSVAAPVTLTDYTDRLKDANINNIASFGSAAASTGLASASLFYLDYGGFRVLTGGVRDVAFVNASVDAPGTDCISNSYSNTPDANGLIGCLVASQSNSALIGRFYPASFFMTGSSSYPLTGTYVEPNKIANACGSGAFTYEGQAFSIGNTYIHALSSAAQVAAAIMPRYAAGTFGIGAENNNDGVNLSARVALNVTPTWVNGSFVVNAPAATFSRPAGAPDGPFEALDIGFLMTDPDGATLGNARNMLPTNNTACTTSTCTHQKLTGSPIKMRYGRFRLANAYGSERLDLPVTMEAQYWTGTGFARNVLDGCSTVVAGNVALVNQVSPVTTANVVVSSVTNAGVLQNGVGTIILRKPTPLPNPWSNIGSVDLILNLGASTTVTCPTATPATPLAGTVSANLPFLATNACGATTYDRNPTSRATFGVYKSPVIYGRENY